MKEIESFTAVATVLNSERLIHWSAIGGLTIDGLTRADAVAVMRLVESVSERAREQATGVPVKAPHVARDAPPSSDPPVRVPAVTTPHGAREGVTHDAPTTGAEPRTAAQNRAPTPPAAPDTPPTPAAAPANAIHAPRGAPDTSTPAHVPPAENAPQERSGAPTQSAQKRAKPAPQKRVPRREVDASPAAPDPAPPWMTPKEGDAIDGGTVRAVKPTVEGGAVVTLTNGTRIKFDGKGNEAARVVPEVKTQPPTDEAPTPPSTITPPEEVMKTRMTRDVLKWVMDQGVTERDQIIAECERLKTAGAVAFSTCPDVHQRATTVLTAMGVA